MAGCLYSWTNRRQIRRLSFPARVLVFLNTFDISRHTEHRHTQTNLPHFSPPSSFHTFRPSLCERWTMGATNKTTVSQKGPLAKKTAVRARSRQRASRERGAATSTQMTTKQSRKESTHALIRRWPSPSAACGCVVFKKRGR